MSTKHLNQTDNKKKDKMCKMCALQNQYNTTEGINTTGSRGPFKNSALQGLNLDLKAEFH